MQGVALFKDDFARKCATKLRLIWRVPTNCTRYVFSALGPCANREVPIRYWLGHAEGGGAPS